MSFNPYNSAGWWERTRGMRYVFAAGAIFGIFIGWLFHAVISMAIQFGVVLFFLVPLAIIGYVWWRLTRHRDRSESSMTVTRWERGQFSPFGDDMATDPFGRVRFDQDDVIDVDEAR